MASSAKAESPGDGYRRLTSIPVPQRIAITLIGLAQGASLKGAAAVGQPRNRARKMAADNTNRVRFLDTAQRIRGV